MKPIEPIHPSGHPIAELPVSLGAAFGRRNSLYLIVVFGLLGCPESPEPASPSGPHGEVAPNISAPLGDPIPTATAEQLVVFEEGKQVALKRFELADGLGPAFNVTFCAACHEKPTIGGSAGAYRNFQIAGTHLPDGSYIPAASAGDAKGVLRLYNYDPGEPARPALEESINVVTTRNAIPFFGVGLVAELSNEELLSREDPDDEDGDGISGRANWDKGFVGRFGRKSQTVSIEGFIRGPLMNHLGITTDPLTDKQRALLPIDSSEGEDTEALAPVLGSLAAYAQAAAPAGPLTDDDGVPDPEMSPDELFKLVSFAMLLAAPELEPPTEQSERGREHFDRLGCGGCHTPRLNGPRGPLPIYSDLLLHDMGPELADNIPFGQATGSEFRTQPLWGIAPVGPYFHDGRVATIWGAIEQHGGEGTAARDAALALDDSERADLLEFLHSLGGREQVSSGLVPPGAAMPEVGDFGGPVTALSPEEEAEFLAGREIFDHEYDFDEGVGAPRFNGDSCRACHFDPVIGGSGPRGVNVMQHGIVGASGEFIPTSVGTTLHKLVHLDDHSNNPQDDANVFEHRQTPVLFGLGLVDAISDEVILANADPDDAITPDGISGRASWTDGARLGRFGWKAQVPTLEEFVRDAVTTELGMTLPYQEGLTFGRIQDNDAIPDPEFTLADAELLLFYMKNLAPPPRAEADEATVALGEELFSQVGCDGCHVPSLEGPEGQVPLYSDLLLHEVLPIDLLGIEQASAAMREFRTPPLWGLRETAPYLHSGEADTIGQAISAHAGEAVTSRDAFEALDEAERETLLVFLNSL